MCKSGSITIEQAPSVRSERLLKADDDDDLTRRLSYGRNNKTGGPIEWQKDILPALQGIGAGMVLSCITVVFSLHFPFIIQPTEAPVVYLQASYRYDPAVSFFDNSVWTYGTDYILAVVMSILAYRCAYAGSDRVVLQRKAAGLFTCYAISVTAGGIAHQFYTTIEERNSLSFRLLWTLCVGTVTAAGGFMGACGAEISGAFLGVFRTSGWVWAGFAALTTAFCAGGMMSFQRPAADIFVAGITQFPSTLVIVEAAMAKCWKNNLSVIYTGMCAVGFSMNAPLLPLYAFLLYHTSWSLPAVNTLLHCWLCITWSMQAISLAYFIGVRTTGKAKATKSA